MKIRRFALTTFGFIALFANLAQADSLKPIVAAPFPPLVSDIQQIFPGQSAAAQAEAVKPGATSGAGGFPAQPSAGVSVTGGSMTTIAVLAILGGLIALAVPSGSSPVNVSSTPSTN